ncbi:hypothetical protein CC1G_04652 [Coprinopsis cinerea okayama7|uniref:Uncharacterized protein n=1 Tax=Coprinopsis cinerea (strain Okayama-7 / 130 / ATCC MYA-4618 / FGSC 9003) TaxID=240176 RepID=A8N545_COPC7|nr:hypothetical protein CC1G_04652 [Coprinopsis cinerea okayama7\|eukprot:XP_001829963.2 hypothetical protein CC1G_04652 [Coprinopsis cinerea okayama7\
MIVLDNEHGQENERSPLKSDSSPTTERHVYSPPPPPYGAPPSNYGAIPSHSWSAHQEPHRPPRSPLSPPPAFYYTPPPPAPVHPARAAARRFFKAYLVAISFIFFWGLFIGGIELAYRDAANGHVVRDWVKDNIGVTMGPKELGKRSRSSRNISPYERVECVTITMVPSASPSPSPTPSTGMPIRPLPINYPPPPRLQPSSSSPSPSPTFTSPPASTSR